VTENTNARIEGATSKRPSKQSRSPPLEMLWNRRYTPDYFFVRGGICGAFLLKVCWLAFCVSCRFIFGCIWVILLFGTCDRCSALVRGTARPEAAPVHCHLSCRSTSRAPCLSGRSQQHSLLGGTSAARAAMSASPIPHRDAACPGRVPTPPAEHHVLAAAVCDVPDRLEYSSVSIDIQ
jgi:hypothetical protein